MSTALPSWLMVVAVLLAFTVRSRAAVAGLVSLLAAGQAAALGGGVADTGAATAAMALAAVMVVRLRERVTAGQEALRDLAMRDPLTGVGNYRLFYERLAYEIARHRRSGEPFAVLLLDLDGFKGVNDRAGHLAGDRVLRDVAGTLQATVRDQDTVARQGGDEFGVLAPGTGTEAAATLAARIESALTRTDVSASVGWALFPRDGGDLEELLERADARQRHAKARRREERRAA